MPVRDVVMMASFLTFRCLALACFILGIHATIDPNEPFMLVFCEGGNAAIHMAQLADTLQFTSIPLSLASGARRSVSYDPVDQKVYFITKGGGIYSVDLDGSNEQKILSRSAVTEILVDPDARKLYFIDTGGLYHSNLDGSARAVVPGKPSSEHARRIKKIGSRILVTGPGRKPPGSAKGIYSLDTNQNVLTDEIYNDIDPEAADIDLAAGRLYWVERNGPIILRRQDIGDYDSTCTQTVLDTTDIHGSTSIPANQYSPANMALYQDYAYVVGYGTAGNKADYSGLLRFNQLTGVLEDVADISQLGGMCSGLHIHDPAKIEAGRGYEGGLNATGEEDSCMNCTTPVNTNITIDIKEQWFGGMTADLVIPITGPMVAWHLELSFPRQVFKLEIQGCDVEISKKTTIRYGRRKGTDFVISPSPEIRSPTPGEDLQISMVAKTWKDVRVMKRGMSAMFVPVTDPLVCDPVPTMGPV